MVKVSTMERYKKIVDLLQGGKREPKDVLIILRGEGIHVSLWAVYKAKARLSKFVQISTKPIWH